MSREPLRPDLWEVTAPAVLAARDAVRAYVDSGKYVPRKEPIVFKGNDAGWPRTVKSDPFTVGREAPIDWSQSISLSDGTPSYVYAGNVGPLRDALEYVQSEAEVDETLAAALDPFFSTNREESRRFNYLEISYKNFIGSIVDRMESLGVTADDDLLEIYLLREKAHFAEELSGDLVVPVTLTDFGPAERLDLSEGVFIEKMTPEFQCARAPDVRSTSADAANPFLVAAATHALVVEGLSVRNNPYAHRAFGTLQDQALISDEAMAKVNYLVQCVHFVTGEKTGYNQVLMRPDDWADGWRGALPAVWRVETVARFPDSSPAAQWHVPRQAIDTGDVEKIVTSYPQLAAAPKDVQLAARRSVRAMMRTNDEDKTLDATIGIEAILMDGNAELKYRMALRAAAALCEQFNPQIIFDLAKKVYDHRSKISHGVVDPKGTFTLGDQTWESSALAPYLLRALLRSRFLSVNSWTKHDLDARILSALDARGKEIAATTEESGE